MAIKGWCCTPQSSRIKDSLLDVVVLYLGQPLEEFHLSLHLQRILSPNGLMVYSKIMLSIKSWNISQYLLWCWLKKDTGSTKGLIEKHIYLTNRNKIQMNLVKQKLVDRKLRVQCGSDYLSTMQMVSHVIVSHWLVHSDWCSHWLVFMEEGESIM